MDQLLESVRDAVVGVDARSGRIVLWNAAATKIFGYSSSEAREHSWTVIVPERLKAQCEAGMARYWDTGHGPYIDSHVVLELPAVRKDGKEITIELALSHISLSHNMENRGRLVLAIIRDVTERKAMEERLNHEALHDSLTDLPNRRLLMDRLGQALSRTRRQHNRVAVLFMDLDSFKVVNDSLGHEVGDLLLTVVAQRLGRCLRPEDTLARFGGDEFTVLIEALDDAEQAVQVAERITDELRRPFIVEGRELHVAASIGISLGDARTHDPDALLREADTAMYRAKSEGGAYTVFDPNMYERALRRLEVENDLRRAIEREEFVVLYQPIVSLQTGEVFA